MAGIDAAAFAVEDLQREKGRAKADRALTVERSELEQSAVWWQGQLGRMRADVVAWSGSTGRAVLAGCER